MADAVPVHKKSKAKQVEPTVESHRPLPEGVSGKELEAAAAKQKADLLSRAQAQVESEMPEIPDALVNSIGQAGSYGKFQKVEEMAYDAKDRKGDSTGEVRYVLRVTH